ncbi:MAG: asparagine synthase (glutamine-hydrolyzing) [Sulfuricella sp.]|nr:asparagine synthase (glutamine-hydrolyzing) [Sulfuricella sp.]
MSGIAGIIRFDGAPVEPGLVEKMTAAMVHRGPDGINHWVKGSVALGQCMLRTTPESLEEKQPLGNEDESLVLVMDGRVDNWEELRRELLGRGAVLRDRSDAELVLRAYEVWGRECLPHIDGDFALVIWDARKRTAFCARDRVGNKPFNYHWDGKTFAFASELHAILAMPWVKEELNEGMLAEFLADERHSRDETFWNGVMRLVAAHRMEVGAGGPHLEQYWEPDLWATLPYTKDEDYIEHYRELFADAVRRMSRSHQPLAIEVSGGLDSSAIFAMAENLRRQQKLPVPAIDGYALDFHDDPDANELEYSRAVGKHLGLQIREIPPTKMPLSWYRDWAGLYREFPGYPNGVMGLGIRAAARDRGSRVLLAGVGGDEWLGGSQLYYAEGLAARQWGDLYNYFREDVSDEGLWKSLWWFGRFGFAPLLPDSVKGALRKVHDRAEGIDKQAWLTPAMRSVMQGRREKYRCLSTANVRRIGQRGKTLTLLDAYSVWARESEERLSSSAGLELRRPFWDSRLIQFCLTTPERLRSRGRINKALHRRAMIGLLPELVLKRESKADFSITFHRHLHEMREELTQRIPAKRYDWVESRGVATLYKRYENHPNHAGWPGWILWALFGCDSLC